MSGTFGSDDQWDNGWSSNDNNNLSSNVSPFGGNSSYLTSSQLLGTPAATGNDNLISSAARTKLDEESLPESYKSVEESLRLSLNTLNDLEELVLDKVVSLGYFTNFQKTKIINTLYDNDLLPATDKDNLYHILGLIALELDTPDTGDYVTLQFKRNNLPPLPLKLVDELVKGKEKKFVDPLTENLENTTLEDDAWKRKEPIIPDPILQDHSAISGKDKDMGKSDPIPLDSHSIDKYIKDIRDRFKPYVGTLGSIKIKEVPEKEGLLFKHINYIITHNLKLGSNVLDQKKVIRRYSDFVWLLEYLLKKYPFRVIPGLPPKKFSVGASPDSQFLQRRRRGLQRFLFQLVQHPVLKRDSTVVTFLSLPSDIATWKKQATIDYSLDFKGQKILSEFINNIWPTIGEEFLHNWATAEANISNIIEVWTKIIVLVERYEKRQQQIAYENGKFVEMLDHFKTMDVNIYPNSDQQVLGRNNKDDINSINDSMGLISDFFNKSSQALIDESYTVNTIILEKFKNYLDYLYSLQELFERTKRLSVNNINQLQTRIKENEARYTKLSHEDADAKASDIAKLRQQIINDKHEIFQQLNKDWLIKNCCFEEFTMFQETQYLVSEMWIDWSSGRLNFLESMHKNYINLNNDTANNMPLNS